MKRILGIIAILTFLPAAFASGETVFRYHIPNEPQSLDPARLTSTDASYFFNNIMRGLYSYSNDGGLRAEGAEACEFETPLKLVCKLSKKALWSDGSLIEAGDYVRTMQRLLGTSGKNPSVDLLKNIKNSAAVHRGEKLPLGIQAPSRDVLIFEFDKPDPDFLFKLTASVLVPTKSDQYPKRGELTGLVFNGPYKVTSWTLGHRLRLEANPHYRFGNGSRPPVEILFVDDDQTALNLYEQKTLTFLRRLPTTYIKSHRARPDFLQLPVARFDYIGFGPELAKHPKLRAALAHGADYKELKDLYDALGMPGCPSLPSDLIDKERCYRFDLKLAKKELAEVPVEVRERRLKLYFSKLGGDDVKKGMEWFQSQWKKNLGLKVDLEQTEQGIYLARLAADPPALFRKGVGLERPTCLAALETFAPDSAENFIRLNDPVYGKFLEKLASRPTSNRAGPSAETKKLCGEGVQYLLDRFQIIPLGQIHFTLLADPRFKGWHLNQMNQLDLSGLAF